MKNNERTYDNNGNYVTIPVTDIYETEDQYSLSIEMPGITKENLEITVNDNELELRGHIEPKEFNENDYSEFSQSDFYRKFKIGNDVDRNNVEASLKDGILSLNLNKTEEVKPKKIEIAVH